jgi:hypothetical protein
MENSNIDSSRCKLCGAKFSSFAEMQQHMTVEHMQKGDIPNTMTNNSS